MLNSLCVPVILQSPDERGIIVQMLESGYRFVLGSIGGGTYKSFFIFLHAFAYFDVIILSQQ